VTVTEAPRAVIAGVGFQSLQPEEEILGAVGVDVIDCRGMDDAEIVEIASQVDAVLTDYFCCPADVIARLERCRIICQYGVGVDRIDIEAATAAGILVTHTPDYCVEEMADSALALMLGVARNVVIYDRAVKGGVWDYNAAPEMRRLSGSTLGLVGCGRIGRAVAKRAQALGMEVIGADPLQDPAALEAAGIRAVELGELLASADVISLHAPLTPDSHEMLGAAEIAAMKPGAILVNTARGALLDQSALADALRSGHLAGAGLDVLTEEPPPHDEPLLALDNVILSPHSGFLSRESLAAVQRLAAEEVRRALTGEPLRYALNAERLA
jgi:D-3-phosphoglycerate dehydrogenase